MNDHQRALLADDGKSVDRQKAELLRLHSRLCNRWICKNVLVQEGCWKHQNSLVMVEDQGVEVRTDGERGSRVEVGRGMLCWALSGAVPEQLKKVSVIDGSARA